VHFKRKLALVITTVAAAAFGGGAYAASEDSPVKRRQAFLSDVAKRLDVSPQALNSALSAAYHDQLNAAVKAGRLSRADADELAHRTQQGLGPYWFGAGPGGGGLRFFGPRYFGAGGQTGPAGFSGPSRRFRPGGPGIPLAAAASYLGLTRAQLLGQLQRGKTLAQLATSKGKSVAGLQQAMVAPIKARLDQAVTDKRITSSEEQRILDQLTREIGEEIKDSDAGAGLSDFFAPFRRLHPGKSPAIGQNP
jgi:hypothetical protein